MSTLEIYLFGQLQIRHNHTPLSPLPPQKGRSLLAYLVLHPNQDFPRALLVGLLWPDMPERQGRRALSQTLWQLRRMLGSAVDRLVTSEDCICFNLSATDYVDTQAFQTACSTPSAATPSTQIKQLQHAVDLYRGDLLEGFYDDWVLLERERLYQQYLSVLERLVTLSKQQSDYSQALFYARQLVKADPLHEEIHREVMRLYHLLHRDAEALKQFEVCREVLAEELGVEPSLETEALAVEIATRSDLAEPPLLPSTARPTMELLLERPDRLPLVGRQVELAELLRQVETVVKGRGGLTLIYGEAGVGKTRLLQELARNAQWRDVQVVWGRCYELAAPPAYQPLVESLRAGLPVLRKSPLEPLWRAELSRLLPELATGEDLPPPLSPEEERRRLLEAITLTFLTLAETAPHLVLLEDVHWMDPASLEALRYLLPRLAEVPLLLVATARIEELAGQPATVLAALESTRLVRRLELGRLNLAETGELIQRALDMAQPTSRFSTRLYNETEGNPFFLIETLWMLMDEGLLQRNAAGAWSTPWDESTRDYGELPLPTGVAQSIERRLDRLSSPLKEMLGLAAVLGRNVALDLWGQTSGRTEEELLAVGDELCARGLLLAADFDATAGTDYVFAHDQIRRVTYEQVATPRRRFYHRQVAQALEALHPNQVEALAHHFTLARVWDKAAAYNHQAGDRARAVYAGAEAIAYYDQAIEAGGRLRPADESLVLDLYQARGETYRDTGQFSLAETDFQTIYHLAAANDNVEKQAESLNLLSRLQYQRGDLTGATRYAQQALEVAESASLQSHLADSLTNKANVLSHQGPYQRAVELFQQAAVLYEKLNDQAHLGNCLNQQGITLLYMGSYPEARTAIERALAIHRRLDDKTGLRRSLNVLGVLYYYQGQFGLAKRAYQEALEVAVSTGNLWAQGLPLRNLGEVILEQGDPTQAIPLLEQALELTKEIGDRFAEAASLSDLGRANLYLGNLGQAQELLEQALDVLKAGGGRTPTPDAHAYLALVFLALGQSDEALAQAQAGLQAAQEMGDRWGLGLTHRVLGEVAARLGREKAATEPDFHFEESIRILQEIKAIAELARSQAAYGLYLLESADTGQAQRGAALLDQARSIFEQQEMAWDLARLEMENPNPVQTGQVEVRLPHVDAPTGRPLRDDEVVAVAWTITAPDDETIVNKTARRRRRLLRLLREATAQSAAPTVPDLATALAVGNRTIERDLAALRAEGHEIRTRGSAPP